MLSRAHCSQSTCSPYCDVPSISIRFSRSLLACGADAFAHFCACCALLVSRRPEPATTGYFFAKLNAALQNAGEHEVANNRRDATVASLSSVVFQRVGVLKWNWSLFLRAIDFGLAVLYCAFRGFGLHVGIASCASQHLPLSLNRFRSCVFSSYCVCRRVAWHSVSVFALRRDARALDRCCGLPQANGEQHCCGCML